MARFASPGAEPAEYERVVLPEAEGIYATIVVRNHRVVQTGGTDERPVLVREFLDDEEFTALTDTIIEELGRIDDLSLCFVGDGFDPSTIPSADDEEALEKSAAWAAVVFVPPDALAPVRHAVAGALVDHGHPNAWVIQSPGTPDIVVRDTDWAPEPDRRQEGEDFYWYMATPLPHRGDAEPVDATSPAVEQEMAARIAHLPDAALLRCLRQAIKAVPSFDPGEGPPATAMRRVLESAVADLLDGYQPMASRLCLEGEALLLTGEMNSQMHDEEFYALFAALCASGVTEEPCDVEAAEGQRIYEPVLARVGEFVAWYTDIVTDALGDFSSGASPDLADRLTTCLDARQAEMAALLRNALLTENG